MMTLAAGLSQPVEDAAVCHFYYATLETLSIEDPAHFVHSRLPSLYTKSDPGSALRLATEATSYAASARIMCNGALLARKQYVRAIRAIQKAIQDPAKAADVTILYAVLLLGGFEVSCQVLNRVVERN